MTAGGETLLVRGGKRHLRAQRAVGDLHFQIGTQQRLEDGQRLARPPGLPAQPLAVPAAIHAHRPDIARAQLAVKQEMRRIAALKRQPQRR